jgi:outer membrane protein assembly factor BamB
MLAILVSITCGLAPGGDWTHWRGPAYNGASNETNLPDDWSTTKNVTWSTDLPGPSSATPVVSGKHIFLSSTANDLKELRAVCIEADTGKVLWSKSLGTGRKAMRNNMATPSPVTDGKTVYFLYGTGDIAALDFQGKVVWSRKLEKEYGRFAVKFGYSSSPLLYEGKLFVSLLREPARVRKEAPGETRTESYLIALDPASGKEIWKQIRHTPAKEEAFDTYGSPLPCETGGSKGVIVAGGDLITCSDAAGGKELWRYDYGKDARETRWRLIPSVTVAGGVVVLPWPRGSDGLFAITPPKTGGKPAVAWTIKGSAPDVCTSLYYKGLLYVLDGKRKATLSCVDPKSGNVHWKQKLTGKPIWRASPTGADNKIYCMNMAGEVSILAAGTDLKVISDGKINMGASGCMSTIAPANGSLLIRTPKKLYCIRK